MSEWSKEPDLRPGSVSCVGSNPTQCTLGYCIVLPPRGVSWLILKEQIFHSSVGQSIRLLIVGSEVRTLLEEIVRSHGLMVMTGVFETSNLGSIPSES